MHLISTGAFLHCRADRVDNLGAGIVGKSAEPVVSEAEHFYQCPMCGQAVDMRDLGQVFHHEQTGHSPMQIDG